MLMKILWHIIGSLQTHQVNLYHVTPTHCVFVPIMSFTFAPNILNYLEIGQIG